MSTETQTNEVVDDILSNVLGGRSTPAGAAPAQSEQPKAVETQVAQPEPAKPAEAQGEQKQQAEAQAPPAEKPVAVNPYDAAVAELLDGQPAEIEWTPEAKELFKKTYGADDPLAFKKTYEEKQAEADLYKKKYEEVAPVQEQLSKLPPAMYRALQLALEGDVKGAQEYIKTLPTLTLENKEAKDLTPRQKIDTYLPGKVKPEQWDLINDPEADEDVVDALKQRVAILDETASEMHERKRSEVQTQWQQEEAAKKQAFEQFQQGVAAAVANARTSSVRVFVDDNVVKKVQDGSFIFDYVQEDGVTPTPHALTQHLKALHYDNAVKAAEARGIEIGKKQATIESTSRQPTGPRAVNRDPGVPTKERTVEDQADDIILRAVAGR
jgi:hypothetical protein